MIKSNVAPLKKMEYQLVSTCDEIALEKLHYLLSIKQIQLHYLLLSISHVTHFPLFD